MKLIGILFLTAVLGSCTADTVVLNQLMDQVIESMKMVINQGGMNELTVPDMNNDWHYRWHFIKLSGHANCHDGKARSLASLRRTGDATVTTVGNKAIVKVRLGFGDLEFNFGRCQFKAKHLFSVSQHIKVKINSNSVELQVSLTGQGPKCVASLDHVVLDQFGGVKIDTGGGIIHNIEDKLLQWATRHFHDTIVGVVNDKLADAVRKALPKIDLCSKIPH
uniref:Secreted venom protein family 5 protein n=1 Tax=Pristhesancus plagipennis TaxID=1955184 RepID=A0A2K8JMY9_PRIPG|nr:secreted venom protein family 5 protein [Pristhesancus plagipennis]